MKRVFLVFLCLLVGCVGSGPVLSLAASCPRRVVCCSARTAGKICRLAACSCRKGLGVAKVFADIAASIGHVSEVYNYNCAFGEYDERKLIAYRDLCYRLLPYIAPRPRSAAERENLVTAEFVARIKAVLGIRLEQSVLLLLGRISYRLEVGR